MAASDSSGTGNGAHIDKLDYKPQPDERRPLLRSPRSDGELSSTSSELSGSNESSRAGSFFEQVAEGIQERDREEMKKQILRFGGFFWAVVAW